MPKCICIEKIDESFIDFDQPCTYSVSNMSKTWNEQEGKIEIYLPNNYAFILTGSLQVTTNVPEGYVKDFNGNIIGLIDSSPIRFKIRYRVYDHGKLVFDEFVERDSVLRSGVTISSLNIRANSNTGCKFNTCMILEISIDEALDQDGNNVIEKDGIFTQYVHIEYE